MKTKRRLILTAAAVCTSMTAMAQNFNVEGSIDRMNSKFLSFIDSASTFCLYLTGFAAIMELAYAFYKQSKSDPQSKEAMVTIIVSLLIAVIFFGVVKFAIFNRT